MRLIPLVAFCSSVLFLTAASAQQIPCGPYMDLLRWLEEKYGEKPIATAMTNGGARLEIVVSPSGSWSILSIRSDGLACLVANGSRWTAPPGA